MCCDHIGCSSVGWSVDPVIDKSDIDAEDMDCTGEPFAFSRVSDCDNIRVIIISECQLLDCTGEPFAHGHAYVAFSHAAIAAISAL